MRKVTRQSLDELAKVMPVLSEREQRVYIGGTSGATGVAPSGGGTNGGIDSGSSTNNYFSYSECEARLSNGTWAGGLVEGMGYVSAQAFGFGGRYESSHYYSTASAYTRDQLAGIWDKLAEEFSPLGTGVATGHLQNLVLEGIASLQDKNYNGPIYVLFDSNSTVGMYGREVPRVVIRSAMSGDVLYDSNLTTGYSATGAY
ncbi:hypothetical protein [Bacteroides acidifaciens]|uniref:Uncharacterized protein n=1 Tax=Bacteroides acidifaciens TaxID=85831 RepID=A0A3L7YYC8_9BACE|nr:hypothetical protein [Bacteroides acidifaciens]RLT78268.1 hypothetical protein D7Y07_20215 [Bacteroides acidifaciens]